MFLVAIAFKIKSMYCTEGGVGVCGIAVFLVRCCGNFYFKIRYCGFRVHAMCGKFKFHVAVVGEKIVVSC